MTNIVPVRIVFFLSLWFI